MIKLAIVSDVRLYREGLERLINETGLIEVSLTAENCEEFKNKNKEKDPDVILLDMGMQGVKAVYEHVTKNLQGAKVVVIATNDIDDYKYYADIGVCGYLSKKSTVDELTEAIVTVCGNNVYCSSEVAANLVKSIRNSGLNESLDGMQALNCCLTYRQKQILGLVSVGMSNKKISNELNIEVSTVKNHIHNILNKLGAHNRAEAVFIYLNSMPQV